MFAIKSGNGRGFSPESLKQPMNTYVAGWTVNQEKNILRIISYPQAMVTLYNCTVWQELAHMLSADYSWSSSRINKGALYSTGEPRGCWYTTEWKLKLRLQKVRAEIMWSTTWAITVNVLSIRRSSVPKSVKAIINYNWHLHLHPVVGATVVITDLVVGARVVGLPPSPPLRPVIKRKRIINQLKTSRNRKVNHRN